MQTRQLLILVGVALCAALVIGQPLPSTVPLATREHQSRGELPGISWQFRLNGKQYASKLTGGQIASGPDWNTSSSLPLTLARVEQIAREELRKLVADDSTWEVTELSLKRFPQITERRWYYLVKLTSKDRPSNIMTDSFVFPISFSGEVGQIHIDGQ